MKDMFDLVSGDEIVSIRSIKPEVGWEGDSYVHPSRFFVPNEIFVFNRHFLNNVANPPYNHMVEFTSADGNRYSAPFFYFVPTVTAEKIAEGWFNPPGE